MFCVGIGSEFYDIFSHDDAPNIKLIHMRTACRFASDVRTWSLYNRTGPVESVPVDLSKWDKLAATITSITFNERGTVNAFEIIYP